MKENHISGNMYNEIFSESSEEKCAAFQSMGRFLIVHKKTFKTCSTILQAFSSRSLSLYPFALFFCCFFHKGKATSAITQPSIHHLVYVSPIFFRFRECFNYFHLSENLLTNKFFC